MKLFFFTIFLIFSNLAFTEEFFLGKFSIGESRIKVDLKDFVIRQKSQNIKLSWVEDSVQWIRNENNLLVPRALLKIESLGRVAEMSLKYQQKTIIPSKDNEQLSVALYINLFNPDTIQIFSKDQLVDTISIDAKPVTDARSKQLIDYSCSPYELKIDGIDSEYLSIGCKMHRLGAFGSERPRLEISLSSTNLKTLSNETTPFTVFLEDKNKVEIELKSIDGEPTFLKLEARMPKKLHRFKSAFGFGPYVYQSQLGSAIQNSNLAPSIMLYGKFDLTDTTSIKGFEALLYSKTFFNNAGIYFSYDLAEILDGRVLINTLLGFQALHYRYSPQSSTQFRLIYPQGFEVLYKHAFIENYNLFYGMFLSTSSETYTNAWIRYGKRSFVELNYITWGLGQSLVKMWGVSIGVPFLSFL